MWREMWGRIIGVGRSEIEMWDRNCEVGLLF